MPAHLDKLHKMSPKELDSIEANIDSLLTPVHWTMKCFFESFNTDWIALTAVLSWLVEVGWIEEKRVYHGGHVKLYRLSPDQRGRQRISTLIS